MIKSIHLLGYDWPTLRADAIYHVQGCPQCLQFSVPRHGYHPLKSIEAHEPLAHIAIDLAGAFPTSHSGNHYMLLVIDIFSKFVVLEPIADKTGPTVARTLLKIFTRIGFPRVISSDNGQEFVNQLVKLIHQCGSIDARLITPYSPRSNGAAERSVQTTTRMLAKLVDSRLQDWDEYVDTVSYFYNLQPHSLTGSAPFDLFFARRANGFIDHNADLKDTIEKHIPVYTYDPKDIERHYREIQEVIRPAIASRQRKLREAAQARFNKKHKLVEFQIGSLVAIADPLYTRKLEPKYHGPFRVVERTRGGSYRLENYHINERLPERFAPHQLKPISHDPLIMEEDSDNDDPAPLRGQSYHVEKILAHREMKKGQYEYYVKWKGYSRKHNLWIPAENFDGKTLINNYWRGQPGAQR